jgi:hypothetical protein
MHVAFSDQIKGVGVFAGGPYWCFEDNQQQNLSLCTTNKNGQNVDFLERSTHIFEDMNWIANTSHLKNNKVFIFSGTLDSVIVPGVVDKTY